MLIRRIYRIYYNFMIRNITENRIKYKIEIRNLTSLRDNLIISKFKNKFRNLIKKFRNLISSQEDDFRC